MELQPFVLCGFLLERKWSPMKLWTEKYLKDRFGNKGPLVVRMGKKPKPKGEVCYIIHSESFPFSTIVTGGKGMENIATSLKIFEI